MGKGGAGQAAEFLERPEYQDKWMPRATWLRSAHTRGKRNWGRLALPPCFWTALYNWRAMRVPVSFSRPQFPPCKRDFGVVSHSQLHNSYLKKSGKKRQERKKEKKKKKGTGENPAKPHSLCSVGCRGWGVCVKVGSSIVNLTYLISEGYCSKIGEGRY